MFACSLPEETNVRCRWLRAVRRDIAAHIKDAAIAWVIVRCWTHTTDGRIEAAEKDQRQRWRAPSMRWHGGAWRFGDVVPRTHDASDFDSDDDEGDADRATGSAASVTKRDQYVVDWDDIVSAHRPAMEAARLMHTARQMADTPRRWLMRWPRNAASLLVCAGGVKDDEACKLFRALRVTAVKFGLELASQPKARRDAKEATDARAALQKRWVAMVKRLGPGYRTKRGVEMPDWVAVAHLSSYKDRRILHRWSVEVPRAIMPNRQRTMHCFYTAAGARVPPAPAPLPAKAAKPAARASNRSHADASKRISADATTKHIGASTSRRSAATATPARDRRHNTGIVPAPWGVAPQQDALRGVITCHDADGRCSYSTSH